MRCQINPAFQQQRRQTGNVRANDMRTESRRGERGTQAHTCTHTYTHTRTCTHLLSTTSAPPRSCGTLQTQRAACTPAGRGTEDKFGGRAQLCSLPARTVETTGFQRVAEESRGWPMRRASCWVKGSPTGAKSHPMAADLLQAAGRLVSTAPQKVPILTALGGDFGLPNVLEDGVALLVFHGILVLLGAAALLGHPRGALIKTHITARTPRASPTFTRCSVSRWGRAGAGIRRCPGAKQLSKAWGQMVISGEPLPGSPQKIPAAKAWPWGRESGCHPPSWPWGRRAATCPCLGGTGPSRWCRPPGAPGCGCLCGSYTC